MAAAEQYTDPELTRSEIDGLRGPTLLEFGSPCSFGVKLWPTLVFLKDGRELARLVRPTNVDAIRGALSIF